MVTILTATSESELLDRDATAGSSSLWIPEAELERTTPRLELSDKDEKTLEAMVNAIVNKLLHRPLSELKSGAEGPDADALIDATRRLFDLEEGRSLPPPAAAKTQEASAEGADANVLGELATATSGSGRGENR